MGRNGYVVVIGGSNIDYFATPDKKLMLRESNPGKLRISCGGVGRNIAENLARLGEKVVFISAFGTDRHSQLLKKSCTDVGIDISHSLTVRGGNATSYISVTDDTGSMFVAVSDMELYNRITKQFIWRRMDIINGADMVCVDTNMDVSVIEYLTENCRSPMFCDPVSAPKAIKIRPFLGRLDTVKPNLGEAEVFLGVKIDDLEGIEYAARNMLSKGVRRLFISCGARGALCADKDGQYLVPPCRAEFINDNGAGDTGSAVIIKSLLDGRSVKQAAMLSQAASAFCVESELPVCRDLTMDMIERRAKENYEDFES